MNHRQSQSGGMRTLAWACTDAPNARPHRAHGMTLVEVTASTATITVLFALLLPAMSQARRESKQVHCLGNLARLAEATTIYATTDRHELAIPAHPLIGLGIGTVGATEWGGKSGVGEPLSGSDPSSSKWGTAAGRGPATRPLNKIIYGDVLSDFDNDPGQANANWLADSKLDLDAFRCPADHGYSGYHYQSWRYSGLTSFDHYGNSYAASTAWVATSVYPNLWSNSSFLRPISRVPNPANALLLLENAGQFAWRKNFGIDACQSVSVPLAGDVEADVRGWHGRPWQFQVAFTDGHAGTVHIKGHDHPQPRIGRYPWSETYEFWGCAIIRGDGWQKDTLPAPPVPTNIPKTNAGAVVVIG